MRSTPSFLLALFVAFFTACSDDTNEAALTPEEREERAMDEAATCDPLVGEFRDLMAEYESALKDMIAAKKVDPESQQHFSDKAGDLSKRIQERGEKSLGLKCWNEFNTIGRTYGPRIAKLGMEAMMMEGGVEGLEGMEGMDPAAMEQMKKFMGQ
ncbi:MAG: hypothetical protein KDC00_01380 [Flavobacteriales bacterium]|nr:hypothetical protein [Flavobacteriales bacterium]